MNKKRLLGILLSITLILGLTPGICMTARATDPIEYNIWIKGTQVTDANKDNLPCDSGNVSFNSTTNTLTLNNANITESSTSAAIKIGAVAANLTIEIKGNNIVKNTYGHYDVTASGIYSYSQNIIIKGDGELEASGCCGISLQDDGNLKIENGNITATSNDFTGIFVGSGSLTINGGNVTATGEYAGIDAESVEINNGTVSATNNNSNGTGGIYTSSGSINISGGNVTATGVNSGIYTTYGSVTISGGNVNSKSSTNNGTGIITYYGLITIEGGDVYATGGQCGIKVTDTGNVIINGGVLHAEGIAGGIYTGTAVTITGGKVYTSGTLNGTGITANSLLIESGEVYTNGSYSGIYCNYGDVRINGGCVVSTGTSIAIRANSAAIKNEIFGRGWDNIDDTGEGNYIDRNPDSGYASLSYKKVQFLSAMVLTKPKAKSLTYNNTAQELVTAGVADAHGTMKYLLGENDTTPPTGDWDTVIPTGTNVGEYYVWYRAESTTAGYDSSVPKCVTVTIKNKPSHSPSQPKATVKKAPGTKTLTYTGKPQALATKGDANGGTMQYALGTDSKRKPTDGWSENVPNGTDVGTYHVWYKVVGDSNHSDVTPKYAGSTVINEPHSDNVISIDEEKGIATVRDDISGGTSTVPIECITKGKVYRLYNPISYEHLFTKNSAEATALISMGWQDESGPDYTGVNADDEDATPVYRLYNPYLGGMHLYTNTIEEARYLGSIGWTYEGIAYYVYNASSTKGRPQHRLYNPYSGEHLWTSNELEISTLVATGWIDEGICWRIA